ncbi:MAG: HD domain-containing protein [Chloroflexi bacterium]|nr:HD domain-containing protein [Chloroflexota bacterium]
MPSLSGSLYRARQFLGALSPRVARREREEATAVLGERLLALFDSMSARDQRHCLDVYLTLRAGGCDDQDVLAAALLHDAGKGRLAGPPVRLWHRVAYVVLASTAPGLLERLAEKGGPFGMLRAGLGTLHRHCERGAELAAALGAPPAVVELVRQHEDREAGEARLRAADDAC